MDNFQASFSIKTKKPSRAKSFVMVKRTYVKQADDAADARGPTASIHSISPLSSCGLSLPPAVHRNGLAPYASSLGASHVIMASVRDTLISL